MLSGALPAGVSDGKPQPWGEQLLPVVILRELALSSCSLALAFAGNDYDAATRSQKGAKAASPGQKEKAMFLEHVIDRVESSAYWRDQKAEQYPDDNRNVRSSRALEKLAENLRALSADDEHATAYEAVMERLAELADNDADKLYDLSEHESHYIGRYGFDYPQDGNPSDFLSALTEHCRELVAEAEESIAEEVRERTYEVAKETAGEAIRKAAHEAAVEAAKEAAEKAAQKAYKKAYDKAYKEAYEDAHREALIEALN